MSKEKTVDEVNKKFLQKDSISGKNKLYSCDMKTGNVKKEKPQKEYYRHNKTGAITAQYFIIADPMKMYLSTISVDKAKYLFEQQFAEMAEDLEEDLREKQVDK